MTPYSFGDILLVSFPFTDQTAFKQRPAVVVSSAGYNSGRPDVVIMAITSQVRSQPDFGEVRIVEWQSAGLLRPSTIKPVIATVEQKLILRILGALQVKDQSALRAAMAVILG